MERWRDIAGYGGRYQVSNLGRVRSVGVRCGGRVRKLRTARNGYVRVNLVHDSRIVTESVHVLVADAFLSPRPSDVHQVNHKDGVKQNNSATNLEWATASENVTHTFRVLGRTAQRNGERPVRLQKDADVLNFESMKAAATRLGVHYTSVSNAARKGHRCQGCEVTYA